MQRAGTLQEKDLRSANPRGAWGRAGTSPAAAETVVCRVDGRSVVVLLFQLLFQLEYFGFESFDPLLECGEPLA